MKTFIRDPLIHFLLIGAALFLVFSLTGKPVGSESDRIIITQGQIDSLKASFARTWQRQPTEEETLGLTESYIRDEILYREALALGLDRDDPIIRRRLKQKLEFMSDDLASIVSPTDEQLVQFMSDHPQIFRRDPLIAFRHIYLKADKNSASVLENAALLLKIVSDPENTIELDTLGDSLMLPKSFELSPISDITRLFGESFGAEILKIQPGNWAGPVMSGYGLHLVMVNEKIDGRQPQLDEVRDVVEREWLNKQKNDLRESLYSKLREKYQVEFEQPVTVTKELSAAAQELTAAESKK